MGIDYNNYLGPYTKALKGLQSPSWGDVVEDLEWKLHHVEDRSFGDFVIWLPNVRLNVPRECHMDREDLCVAPVTVDLISSEMEVYLQQFDVSFKILAQHYEKITHEWGWLVWCS